MHDNIRPVLRANASSKDESLKPINFVFIKYYYPVVPSTLLKALTKRCEQ